MKRKFLKLTVLSFIMVMFSLNATHGQAENKNPKQKPPSVEALFEKMDVDNDNKLVLDEVKGRLRDEFEKIDTNSDGAITMEELEMARKPDRDSRKGKDVFKDLDVDKDGKIALSEAKGRLRDNFSKVDSDADGFITKEELEKAPRPNGERKPVEQN